jgi:signal transduction histidine kinase
MIIAPLPETCPAYGRRLTDSQQPMVGHVAVPIVSKSLVVGSLNLVCTPADSVSDEDVQLLSAIGQQLGVAVENARLWETVRQKEAARGELLEKIITAQEEERTRISRELHDGAGQALTSLMVGLKVLSGLRSSEDIQQQIGNLRDIAAETLETIRDLALELRPSVLDDLGLVAAIGRYAAECQRRFNLRVDSRAIGFEGRRLSPVMEVALYRVTQEALTNVARHSGARQASVLLEWAHSQVRLLVEDNGRGFDASLARQERKLGLYGMEERAALIGGTLRIESEPGLGTTVVVQLAAPKEEPRMKVQMDRREYGP